MWNDRVEMMSLVQECLITKHPSKMGLITDTLIAKGYHRCDKDERKKMDAVDRKADEAATMRLRSKVLLEVADHFMEMGHRLPEDAPGKWHYSEVAMDAIKVASEYTALRVEIEGSGK